jgi:hypothetical protein
MDPASLALPGLEGPGVFLNTGPKKRWGDGGCGARGCVFLWLLRLP